MDKLDYFKNELTKILDKQLAALEKKTVKKSFSELVDEYTELMQKANRSHLVPKQIRVTNSKGKTYTTTVWVNPNMVNGLNKYKEADSLGARIAIAKLKKAIDNCKNSQKLLNLVLKNKERFSDNQGNPLPIVEELREYVNSKNDELETISSYETEKEYAGELRLLKKRNAKEYGKKRLKHIQDDLTLNKVVYNEKLLTMKEAEEKIEKLKKETFDNIETGISATFSKRTPGKLVSNAASSKSIENGFTREEHYTIATKIGDLFKNANLVAVEPDRDSDLNDNVKDVKRFAVEFNLNGSKGIALLIVKNTQNAGHKLYSVELAELIKKGSRNLAVNKVNPNPQPIESLSTSNINSNTDFVNEKEFNFIGDVKNNDSISNKLKELE